MTWRETVAKLNQTKQAMLSKNGHVAAAQNGNRDFDEDAMQERRRQERLKRKKEERRDDSFEEEDTDLLLEESKRVKRKKKKKERPALWVDEQLEDELAEVFEVNERHKKRRSQDDWLGEWDE